MTTLSGWNAIKQAGEAFQKAYTDQGGITPDQAQEIYRDSRKAGVINFQLDPGLCTYSRKAISRALHHYPEMMGPLLASYPHGDEDRLLIHEVAIAHKFLEKCAHISLRRQTAIRPNTNRHIIEHWIALNIPETQTGRADDSGYYLSGKEMMIASCLDYPYDTGRFVSWAGNPSTWTIASSCTGLTKASKILTPLHLHNESHRTLRQPQ